MNLLLLTLLSLLFCICFVLGQSQQWISYDSVYKKATTNPALLEFSPEVTVSLDDIMANSSLEDKQRYAELKFPAADRHFVPIQHTPYVQFKVPVELSSKWIFPKKNISTPDDAEGKKHYVIEGPRLVYRGRLFRMLLFPSGDADVHQKHISLALRLEQPDEKKGDDDPVCLGFEATLVHRRPRRNKPRQWHYREHTYSAKYPICRSISLEKHANLHKTTMTLAVRLAVSLECPISSWTVKPAGSIRTASPEVDRALLNHSQMSDYATQRTTIAAPRILLGRTALNNPQSVECYRNATLQCLASFPEYLQALMSIPPPPENNEAKDDVEYKIQVMFYKLQIIMAEMTEPFDPSGRNASLDISRYHFEPAHDEFKGGGQQDAEAFLRYMLDLLEPAPSIIVGHQVNSRGGTEDITFRAFFGYHGVTVSIDVGSPRSPNTSYGPILQVFLDKEPDLKDVTSAGEKNKEDKDDEELSLEGQLDHMTRENHIEGKQYKLAMVGSGLIFNLLVFRYDPETKKTIKTFKRVTYPPILDMSPYVWHPRDSKYKGISEHITKSGQNDFKMFYDVEPENTKLLYDLQGVVVHSGSSACSGHYYAYVRGEDGRWYLFNDSMVQAVPDSDVFEGNFGGDGRQHSAYVLFYRKQGIPVFKFSWESNVPLAVQQKIHRQGLIKTSFETFVDGKEQVFNDLSASMSLDKFLSQNNIQPDSLLVKHEKYLGSLIGPDILRLPLGHIKGIRKADVQCDTLYQTILTTQAMGGPRDALVNHECWNRWHPVDMAKAFQVWNNEINAERPHLYTYMPLNNNILRQVFLPLSRPCDNPTLIVMDKPLRFWHWVWFYPLLYVLSIVFILGYLIILYVRCKNNKGNDEKNGGEKIEGVIDEPPKKELIV